MEETTMRKRCDARMVSAFVLLGISAMAAQAQIVSTGGQNRPAIAKDESVSYLFPEQVTVPAGKANQVALHFRVAQGLHINSHTPSDDYLIPTEFSIPNGGGVRLDTATYPTGTVISLPADPKTRLSVYTGEFIIQARIVAAQGNHLVQAKLHYQACDQSQCLPPKTINVPIDVIGK
jgi:DsbC/DsbD-like thiol-disulfide interchange protein